MNKNILKNSWVLAGLLILINLILALISLAIEYFIDIGSALASVVSIISTMVVGQIYAINFKEIMPKKIRINVTLIYLVSNLLVLFLFFSFTEILFPSLSRALFVILMMVISLVICLPLFFLIYWLLGYGGKSYLKMMEKKAAAQKK